MNNDSLYLYQIHQLSIYFQDTMDDVLQLLNNKNPLVTKLLKLMLWTKPEILWNAFGSSTVYHRFKGHPGEKDLAGYSFFGSPLERINRICHFISYDMLDDGNPGLAWSFFHIKDGCTYCLSEAEMNELKAAEPTEQIFLASVESRWDDVLDLLENVFTFKPMITSRAELVSIEGLRCTLAQVISTIEWHVQADHKTYLDFLDMLDDPQEPTRDFSHPYLYDHPDKEQILIREWMIANNIAPEKPCIE